MGPTALSAIIEGLGADSAPEVFCRAGAAWGSRGSAFGDEVLGLGAALSGYGLRPGACAAVLGAEGFGTLCADVAIIAAGATLLPLDPGLSDDAVCRALASSGAVHAIASDERQLARVLSLRPDLPSLELVLLVSAAPSERKAAALLVEAAVKVGAASLAEDPDLLRRALAESEGGTSCLLVDAVGGTRPVARASLVTMVDVIAQATGISRGKTMVAALSVGGVERIAASLAAIKRGATLLLPDPAQRPDAGLDQRPADAILLDVAGLERLYRAWIEDVEAKSWLGRGVTRWALRQGRDAQPNGWKHRVAENLALRGLREKLGGRAADLNVIATPRGGASPEVDSFFAAAGLSVRYLSPDPTAVLAR